MKVDKHLKELLLSIVLENVDLTEEILKEVYKQINLTKKEILNLIWELYLEHGAEGAFNISNVDKIKVDKRINDALANNFKELGFIELEVTNKILEEAYKNTYYKTAYVLKSGLKKADKLKLVRKEHIESVIKTKFKDEMYSDRIWKNKEQMINVLKKELNEAMTGKRNLDQVTAKIRKEFNVTAYEARRLARTEMCRVQAMANEDIARDEGVQWQMYDATLDGKTCETCRELDGKVYEFDDPNKPIPPLHPYTRSHLIDLPNKEWKPNKKWDNENKETIDYKNYTEWLKENGVTEQ